LFVGRRRHAVATKEKGPTPLGPPLVDDQGRRVDGKKGKRQRTPLLITLFGG